jgi:hypothetical protein
MSPKFGTFGNSRSSSESLHWRFCKKRWNFFTAVLPQGQLVGFNSSHVWIYFIPHQIRLPLPLQHPLPHSHWQPQSDITKANEPNNEMRNCNEMFLPHRTIRRICRLVRCTIAIVLGEQLFTLSEHNRFENLKSVKWAKLRKRNVYTTPSTLLTIGLRLKRLSTFVALENSLGLLVISGKRRMKQSIIGQALSWTCRHSHVDSDRLLVVTKRTVEYRGEL